MRTGTQPYYSAAAGLHCHSLEGLPCGRVAVGYLLAVVTRHVVIQPRNQKGQRHCTKAHAKANVVVCKQTDENNARCCVGAWWR